MTGEKISPEKARWIREALDRYEGPLVRYAASLLGDIEAARDVAQDAFLRLCAADREKIEGRLAPWLFAVCRNRAFDLCKKEERMNPLDDSVLATRPSSDPGPAEAFEAAETQSRVSRAIGSLPGNQQEVIRLKFQEGMTYKEIGKVTGCSVGNVGFLLHTALKSVRERLDGDLTTTKGGLS